MDGVDFESQYRQNIYLFSKTFRLAVTNQISHSTCTVILSLAKQLGHEVDLSPPSTAKVKNQWSCTFGPLYALGGLQVNIYLIYTYIESNDEQ
jgi:hypothetical protein